MIFYFTMAQNQIQENFPTSHQLLGGYVEVHARNATDAVQAMMKAYGPRWVFRYQRLDEIHELDRNLLEVIEVDS